MSSTPASAPRRLTAVHHTFLGIAVALGVLWGSTGSARAANIIVGNCNQIAQNITAKSGATVIIENDCVADTPEKSFRVRYFWLDALTLSLLMAGHTTDNLKLVAGASPQMLTGGVHSTLKEILDKFGERVTSGYGSFVVGNGFRIVSQSGEVGPEGYDRFGMGLYELPEPVRRRLRIYTGNWYIDWPDVKAYSALYDSPRWPPGYALAYRNEPGALRDLTSARSDAESVAAAAFSCVSFYKFVTRQEFDTFWDDLAALGRWRSRTGVVVETRERAHLPSYEALAYFGAQNWPDDFLIRVGNFVNSVCGAWSGYEIRAFPRDLFVLVAVIEATGKHLKLTDMHYRVDPERHLRKRAVTSEEVQQSLNLPAFRRGDTLVVPLRIELRYDLESELFEPLRKNAGSIEIQDAIARQDGEVLSTTFRDGDPAEPPPTYTKRVDAFREPSFSNLTRTYVFGEAREIAAVSVDGVPYAVRETPRFASLHVAGFEGGSCPFLHIVESDGESTLHGRVLVGASSEERARTDVIPLPVGARAVVLSELEAEFTRIDEIAIFNEYSGRKTTLARNLVLSPGRRMTVRLPASASAGDELLVTGYYEALTALANGSSGGPPTSRDALPARAPGLPNP